MIHLSEQMSDKFKGKLKPMKRNTTNAPIQGMKSCEDEHENDISHMLRPAHAPDIDTISPHRLPMKMLVTSLTC